jgi:hypothetical protein
MSGKIDPSRTDLAREFRAKPYGRHSDDLQRVLNIMRGGPNAGRLVALCVKRHKEWVLGRIVTTPQAPIERVDGRVFNSFEAIEWEIFKIRWRDLTGQEMSDA